MPVVDLTPSKSKEMPFHWTAFHNGGDNKCEKEAFHYVTFFKPEKKFKGAMIYYRGKRPIEITDELVNSEQLRCETCNAVLKVEEEITPAPEIFKVKSLMRHMKILTQWHNALDGMQKAHVRMLEYGYLLGVDYNRWREQQEIHDRNFKSFQDQLERLYGFCAGIGPCEAKPSDVVVASRFGGVPLSVLKGQGPGGSPGPSGS